MPGAARWCSGKDCDSSPAVLCPEAMMNVQAKIFGAKQGSQGTRGPSFKARVVIG